VKGPEFRGQSSKKNSEQQDQSLSAGPEKLVFAVLRKPGEKNEENGSGGKSTTSPPPGSRQSTKIKEKIRQSRGVEGLGDQISKEGKKEAKGSGDRS